MCHTLFLLLGIIAKNHTACSMQLITETKMSKKKLILNISLSMLISNMVKSNSVQTILICHNIQSNISIPHSLLPLHPISFGFTAHLDNTYHALFRWNHRRSVQSHLDHCSSIIQSAIWIDPISCNFIWTICNFTLIQRLQSLVNVRHFHTG